MSFAAKKEFRTVSKVPRSLLFLTVAIFTLISALETLLFSRIGIHWIGIVMLFGLRLVITEVTGQEHLLIRTIAICKRLWIWISRKWMWMAGLLVASIVMVICVMYYFLTNFRIYFFRKGQLIAKVLWSLYFSSKLIHFRMLEVHSWGECSRLANSEQILQSLEFWHETSGAIFELVTFETN